MWGDQKKTLKKQWFLNTSWFVSRIKENQKKAEKPPTAVFLSTDFRTLSRMKLLDWHIRQTGPNSFRPLRERSSIEHDDFHQHIHPMAPLSRSVHVDKAELGLRPFPNVTRARRPLSFFFWIELTRIVKRWEDFFHQRFAFHQRL